MHVWNTAIVLVGLAAAASLLRMRSTFSALEKFLYFMVLIIAHEHLHTAIAGNLKLLAITDRLSTFAFYQICQLVVFPIVALWLMYIWFQPRARVHLLLKMAATAGWLWGLNGLYLYMHAQDIVKFTGWNWRYLVCQWLAVLALSLGFALWFRKRPGKRDRDAAAA